VYGRLRGVLRARDEADLEPSSRRGAAIGQELLFAARTGKVVARRVEQRIALEPTSESAEPVLGPPADEPAPDSTTWVGVTLADQDGKPVPNRPYRIIKPDGATIDGVLDSHGSAIVKGLTPGNCQIWCPYVAPHPQLSYTVQDGDHLSGIAESFGFDDYKKVWNDADNADLQNLRPDPHVLTPGDVLSIPELKAKAAANKPTGAKHPFTIQASPLELRLTLLDLAVKPVAGVPVTVAGDALTTDDTGLVDEPIAKDVKNVKLTWGNDDRDLRVGALNPSDDKTEAGYRARLVNMGFLWDPMADDAEDEMIIALQDFQAQYSLPLTGKLDDATKAQLTTAYGC
jgi:N-acetylmuramoyl-L-alanine amidase